MTEAELTAAARDLWTACQAVKPDWDQLGEVTKEVWRDRVRAGLTVSDYLPHRGELS